MPSGIRCNPSSLSYQSPFLLRPFPYLGSAHRVFNLYVFRSCAFSICTCFSFFSFLVTSLHLCFGLPIFRCPPTNMFSLLHLLQSLSPLPYQSPTPTISSTATAHSTVSRSMAGLFVGIVNPNRNPYDHSDNEHCTIFYLNFLSKSW